MEHALYLVCNQYQSGNEYWHGFSELAPAKDFQKALGVLGTTSTIHYGVVAGLSGRQLEEASGGYSKGCTLQIEQLPTRMKEIVNASR